LLVNDLINNGITDILLFGLPYKRDEGGTAAADNSGAVQVATIKIKLDFG
jgi:porphobilinogen synthase